MTLAVSVFRFRNSSTTIARNSSSFIFLNPCHGHPANYSQSCAILVVHVRGSEFQSDFRILLRLSFRVLSFPFCQLNGNAINDGCPVPELWIQEQRERERMLYLQRTNVEFVEVATDAVGCNPEPFLPSCRFKLIQI